MAEMVVIWPRTSRASGSMFLFLDENSGIRCTNNRLYARYSISGWAGLIRVDGNTYSWMGNSTGMGFTPVTQEAFTYTATRSIFTMSTPEGVSFNVTFLSPIYPNDYKRHSQTATYLDVSVWANDGNTHEVEVYSDISAEWISTDPTAIAQWDFALSDDGKVLTHNVYRQTQLLFTEDTASNGAVANWGNWLWSTGSSDTASYQSGADSDVRGQFTDNGSLIDQGDTEFRAINDRWPVFAFAHSLGQVNSTASSALFTIGLYQEQAIQFEGKNGIVSLPGYWTNFWNSANEAAAAFYEDYSYAADAMTTADARIRGDAVAAAGDDYAAIVELSYRQAYGGVQLAGTEDNYYVFLKEISSDGNVGTVDVIYPAFPVFLYDNPDFIKGMLDPLFENQESGDYPLKYAEHDIGASYPNATGHNDGNDEHMAVEEPGNMLIMTLAYVQATNNTDYLAQHYDILKQWNNYLVEAALIPAAPPNDLSTDDFAGNASNQTDLALKGIIGIAAMAEIAQLTNNTEDAKNFTSVAKDYITQWQTLGINKDASPPHTTFSYNDPDSHGLLYNLYADKLLGLNLVPQSVYDMQSEFYQTVGGTYGVALDTRWNFTKLDWQLWCAAIASKDTQDFFHSRIVKWINETPANAPLTDLYEVEGGNFASETNSEGVTKGATFAYRPVVGGVFALLTL